MVDRTNIAVLNIGSQRIGMAVFKPTKSGDLVLNKYKSTNILADPAAESSRLAQVKIAISELAQTLGVNNRVSFALSGQSVFSRFVKLPALDDSDVEQLVTYEAQTHIPFPIDEVIWDWQELGEVDGEKEVIIVAVKSDVLNDVQKSVDAAGMITRDVDASPIALYNAFKLNYPDYDEPCMVLDIGAKTSNVIYIDGNRFFTRSIAIGGAAITSAISKEYNVTFSEAEEQKCGNGMVALDTRHTSKLDDLTAALATCIRTSLNRMPAEIARTTNFYRSQQGGSAPKRVFLAGGGGNLPNMVEFLQEKLRLPVEYFNAMRTVAVGKDVDVEGVQKDAHLMGELVGLAMRKGGKAGINVDLVPDSVSVAREFEKKKPKMAIGAAALVIGMGFFSVFGMNRNAKAEGILRELKDEKSGLQDFDTPIKKLQSERAGVDSIVREYVEVQHNRYYWIEALNELKQNYAKGGFWFTSITPVMNFKPETEDALSYIQNEYKGATDGTSYITKPKLKAAPRGKKGAGASSAETQVVNALLVRGIWLKDGSSGLISSLTRDADGKRGILNDSKYFSGSLTYKDKKGALQSVELEDHDIVRDMLSRRTSGQMGATFELLLPLKNPFEIK